MVECIDSIKTMQQDISSNMQMQQDDNSNEHYSSSSPPVRHFLLMENKSKTTHLGTLLRCAAAFRAHQVLIVGHDKFNAQGSFGSHLYLDIIAFPTWESVVNFLNHGGNEDRARQNSTGDASSSTSSRVPIVGIAGAYGGGESVFSPSGIPIHADSSTGFATLCRPSSNAQEYPIQNEELKQISYPIHTRPFSSDVCFLLSKDKRGLPIPHARLCDSFVHVPQMCLDSVDTEDDVDVQRNIPERIIPSTLLETATIYSIVLHHFTAWAKYDERNFAENQKFVKDDKSDMRRRLCRRYVEDHRTNLKDAAEDDTQSDDQLVIQQGFFTSDY